MAKATKQVTRGAPHLEYHDQGPGGLDLGATVRIRGERGKWKLRAFVTNHRNGAQWVTVYKATAEEDKDAFDGFRSFEPDRMEAA